MDAPPTPAPIPPKPNPPPNDGKIRFAVPFMSAVWTGLILTAVAVSVAGKHLYDNMNMPPTLSLPSIVYGDPSKVVEVHATTNGSKVIWFSSDSKLSIVPPKHTVNTKMALVIGSSPGMYELRAIAIRHGLDSDEVSTRVVIGNVPQPQPGPTPPWPIPPEPTPVPPIPPGPTPTPPTPTPVVVGTLKYIVIIEDTLSNKLDRAAFLNDEPLISYIKSKGYIHRIEDMNVVGPDKKPPAYLAPYLAAAKGKPMPFAFLVSDKGQPFYQGPLPATPAEFLTLLKQFGDK